jgi:glycosyltransferase involved in cell wall biosynthesis
MNDLPRRNLQVLMSADTLGGIWDYALELSTQLSRFGIRTALATMGRIPCAEQRRAAAAVPGLELYESDFRLEWMPETGDDLERAGEWLLGLERQIRPDIVHLNGYVHASLPWSAPCLVVAHSCVLSWWTAVKNEPAPPEWDDYARRVRRGLRDAAMVVTPTHALLDAMTSLYGPLPHARVIGNGRNPQRFRLDDKEPMIFSAGRLWDEAKNMSALNAIAHEVGWPLIAAGDWQRPDGKGQRPAGLQTLGVISSSEVSSWLSRAAIYALPARYEPFGLSILEAALSGCALVLGDIPTLRELWDGTAIFVPPDDHERLLSALQALICHPIRQTELGLAARRRALTYSAERMGRSYHLLYCELLRPQAAISDSPIFQGSCSWASSIKR